MNITSPSVASGVLLAGKYRVERTIGEGGMGVVLSATNEALRQRVAIKLLRSGALANAKALGRFEREARAAASLRSEHVARVLDVGKLDDGRPYMVMEYLEGQDLGDVIDHGAELAVGDAVDYVLQACEAVAEAHASGIIHRDLKPKNLFLTQSVHGRPLVKVLDFGISKIEDEAEDMSLTRTTEIIGSPSYMSPEQLRASKQVDVRTDIWALGVILFELLTKSLPFQATTVTELVAVVLTDPLPDLRVVRPDVPPELAAAVGKCLEKKRDDRFASVADLVRAIAPFARIDTDDDSAVARVARVAAGSGKSLSASGTGPRVALSPTESASNVWDPKKTPRDTVPLDNGVRAPAPGPSAFPEPIAHAPPPSSSARLNIHGGTSVAWGETQVDAGVPRGTRARWPLVAGALGLLLVAAGVGTGAFFYTKRGGVATAPAAGSITLPPGRKDLPPVESAVPTMLAQPTPSAAATPTETPSALPSSRVPTRTRPAEPKAPSAGPTKPASAPNPIPPTAKPAQPDDLSNIGRR
jgi:serine/threonine-protein kinase